MKILITGICGSGGSYLAEYLIKKNFNNIYGIYRSSSSLNTFNTRNLVKNKKITFYKCDLNNFKKLKYFFAKNHFKYIFHIASDADVLKSFYRPQEVIINNNNCTLNLLEALRLSNSKSRIVICSTSEVYGNVPARNQPISERNLIQPINPYAVSKTFQDLLAQNYHSIYGLDIIITRMFTYFNARRENLFASAFAKQIVLIENKKQKILKHGFLGSQRTILDIRDAMNAYYLAATKGKSGEIYNMGGKTKIKVGDVLARLIKLSKVQIKTSEDKNLIRPKDINFQIPDSKKFIKHTNWKQKYNFSESLDYLLAEVREKYKFNLK